MASEGPPTLPVPLAGLVKHLGQHPETPIVEILEPYRKYEAHLRRAFAQDPDNELLKDPHVNVFPLFTEDTHNITIRARNLKAETKEEKSKYIMPLPTEVRRPDGSPAIVQSLKEFQRNFSVFSESSLVELDWDNVVVSGSAVVNTLLPVPDEYSKSKRGLREFYHEKFCPASDVDLFMYGLTEEQAIEKIKEIETRVRDSILSEITVVRTKHAVTICSQYPTRHIQIVLRIYKSVSEILTGFDIDCSGAAYDGKQVYCTPRALQSYMTQVNQIDLSRRSPSYENRLSKYSHRGFEVHWPDFDRSRIDPTIFERSFQRTLGLARLLVLERLPTPSARDAYLDKRREERGRPRLDRYHRNLRALGGNIKENHEDEVADWFTEEEVSNYHTFSIPYGERFNAKRIEKLCYTRDLLLNAEWNQPDDRDVYLHRHPAFFGRFEDVVNDCCGHCPVPKTEDEKAVAENEEKLFVSGRISFMRDDPGRQQIGSFNPLTDDDWTEMAYVGDTARLCQAIVDGDLEHVAGWLSQEGVDPNTRDYTGRTPLHLAVMSSTPEIVRVLIDGGARLVARLADGRTALHLAAARGEVQIVKMLLDKSASNEAEHEEKQDQRRREKKATKTEEGETNPDESKDRESDGGEDSEGELVDDVESDDEAQSMATGSFVKVAKKEVEPLDELALGDDEEEPDFYDINVISWDTPCSALHFAILEGHVEVVKTLVQEYGADVLLPVKFVHSGTRPQGALLTLVLALALPVEKAKEMAKTLLSVGATSAQADMNGVTAFHSYVEANAESLLESLWETDPAGTKTVVNHIAFRDWSSCQTALQVAVQNGNLPLVLKLLDRGAVTHVDFEAWLKSAKQATNMENRLHVLEENQKTYKRMVEQPLIVALRSAHPETAIALLEHGADPNTIPASMHYYIQTTWQLRFTGESALDIANNQLEALRDYEDETTYLPSLPEGMDIYLENFKEGPYQHWAVSEEIKKRREEHQKVLKQRETDEATSANASGVEEKKAAIAEAIETMERVKEALLAKGGKTFVETYPEFKGRIEDPRRDWRRTRVAAKPEGSFEYAFAFHNVNDVTKARKEAYFKLFNASFTGDLETIKTLTLTSWDEAKEEAPLKIAVYDQRRNNPFSIALSRGHYDVAKGILEIVKAQYAPEEKPKTRYRMQAADEDSEYSDDNSECSEESGSSADTNPRIHSQIVDAQFTIENIGQVSMKVNSRTKPLEVVGWASPLSTVIRDNNIQGLKFLLEVYEYWSTQKYDPDDEVSGFYSFPDAEFKLAVELGRVEMLGEIIRRTGAGLPLEHLVKDTGVEFQVKHRYYQGLTVYGKKRNDWATAGRAAMVAKPGGTQTSPLLLAAMAGRIESVEWFLSDTPSRQYLAFANSKAARDDVKLKHLAQAPGGFDGAISKWLDDQSELVLHAAIFAPPSKSATELVSYLVKTQPVLLEVKAANGVTPLLLAYRLGRLDAAKVLVGAGADQTTKDLGRNNLLHAALHGSPGAAKLKPMLDLLDRGTLIPMLKERNKLEQGGQTPLHQFCAGASSFRPISAIRLLKLLIRLSPDTAKQALKMLDGTGDTPLHTLLAKDTGLAVIHALLDFDPSLLCLENAVGRTPAELAHDRYIADTVKFSAWRSDRPNESVSTLVFRSARLFVKNQESCGEPKEHEAKTVVSRNWRLCAEILAQNAQPKRTLVSLNSANFVAQRLGEQHVKARYRFVLAKKDEDDAATPTGSQDEGSDAGIDESTQAKPTATSVEKTKKRRREDVITSKYLSGYNFEWAAPKKEKEDEDEGELDGKEAVSDDDDDLFPVCKKCCRRHY